MSDRILARLAALPLELLGFVPWLLVVIAGRLGLAESLLLWGTFVLTPATLRLLHASPAAGDGSEEPMLWLARRGQFPAALSLAVAFCLPAGPLAALLASPWLIVTALVALAGMGRVSRLWLRPLQNLPELSLAAGMLLLVVGGAWTMISRGGGRPLEFEAVIVLLTGVHFHYAGLMLPVLAGLAARLVAGWTSRLGIVAILVGVPGVGVGITFSPLIEVLSSLLLAAGALWLAVAQMRLAFGSRQPTLLLLWGVSSLALFSGMALAVVYAGGEFFGQNWLTIPAMIPLHGITQAIGFASCGLLAWSIREFGCFPPARHS